MSNVAHELADFVLAWHNLEQQEHAGTAFDPSSKRLLANLVSRLAARDIP